MRRLQSAILLIISSSPLFADWRTDIGWNELQEWSTLNSVTLPDTSSVHIGMTEAGTTSYAPDTANSQFTDGTLTITDVTGASISPSGHATSVASRFFGNTLSLAPDVLQADIYQVDDFISRIQNLSHSSWTPRVMSHAYVSVDTVDVATTTALAQHFDKTTTDSDLLHIVGASNSTGAAPPQIWSYTYNSISVGVTDGSHSYGTVATGYEGAGRQKPEVVNPQTTTSVSTGATASVATLLRARAESHSSTNAKLPVVIKCCILAGADKSKFSDWDNTGTRPIDEIYGAGETNIFSSFRIINENESATGNVPIRGWDYSSIRRSTAEYTITIPSYASSAKLCANLSWDRTVGTSYNTLTNFSLTLKDSSNNTLFSSNSPVDNIEHIWQTNLTPGSYTLTVDKSNQSRSNTPYALAWRVDVETNNSPDSFTHGASSNDLAFADLTPLHKYILQRSSDLSTWEDISTTESLADGSLNLSDPNSGLGEKVFYRLRYYTP